MFRISVKPEILFGISEQNRPVSESIAERIGRAVAGRNQSDLARLLNRSRSAITQWKAGNTEPDLTTFAKLCEVTGVSADWLLGLSPASEVREGPAIYGGDQPARIAMLEEENASLRAQVVQLQVDLRAAERALATSLTTNVIEAAKEAVGMMAAEGKDRAAKGKRGA